MTFLIIRNEFNGFDEEVGGTSNHIDEDIELSIIIKSSKIFRRFCILSR